jgi:hypothetical protein
MKRSIVGAAVVAAVAMVLGGAASALAAEPKQVVGKELGGKVLSAYLEMAAALVGDSSDGVSERAGKIAADAGAAAKVAARAEKAALESLAAAAGKVNGKDVTALRGQFKELSKAMDAFLRASDTPGWALYYCPMADGYWLQAAEPVANPYFGKKMLRCGDRVEKIAS